MTGPALKLTEEQVATLLAQHGSSRVLCDLISDRRTLRAALAEQVKENEREAERRIDAEAGMQTLFERATRAEAALASANEITEEKVERAAYQINDYVMGPSGESEMYESARQHTRKLARAALLAAQGKQLEGKK